MEASEGVLLASSRQQTSLCAVSLCAFSGDVEQFSLLLFIHPSIFYYRLFPPSTGRWVAGAYHGSLLLRGGFPTGTSRRFIVGPRASTSPSFQVPSLPRLRPLALRVAASWTSLNRTRADAGRTRKMEARDPLALNGRRQLASPSSSQAFVPEKNFHNAEPGRRGRVAGGSPHANFV